MFISLGFALVENVFYVLSGGFGTAIVRTALSVPGHGLFGVIMGYYFALAKFSQRDKRKLLCLGLLIPLIVHGVYDFLLFYRESVVNDNIGLVGLLVIIFVVFIIWLWRIGIRYIKKHYVKDVNNISLNSMSE